jgi:hypothetical protein
MGDCACTAQSEWFCECGCVNAFDIDTCSSCGCTKGNCVCNIQPGQNCDFCGEGGHSASDAYECPNYKDCAEHGPYFTDTCPECNVAEPEATTCRHCGEDGHDPECISECPNAIYCQVDTHDTWYVGPCPIHSGDSGSGSNICSCSCGCTNEATHGDYCFNCYDVCQRGPEAT